MSKRTVFTTLTPLPAGVTREVVMSTLREHLFMIDLNPLVEERHRINPPPEATPEEFHCTWYQLTDKIAYLPGGLISGKVSYNACFHDLPDGLQTHCYAPMGLNIKGKWTLGGSLPGEPIAPVELGLGAPLQGLWLREDVDMRCNIMMTSFVKKTLKKAHSHLVGRLVVRAQIASASQLNQQLSEQAQYFAPGSDYSQSEFESHSIRNEGAPPGSPALHQLGSGSPSLTHSSTATSSQGSFHNGMTGRDTGGRVSWQNLKPKPSPSMQNAQPYYQQGNPNGPPSKAYYDPQFHSQEKLDPRYTSHQNGYPGPPPMHHGPAEMEG